MKEFKPYIARARIDDNTADYLTHLAKLQNLTQSELMRNIIAEYCARYPLTVKSEMYIDIKEAGSLASITISLVNKNAMSIDDLPVPFYFPHLETTEFKSIDGYQMLAVSEHGTSLPLFVGLFLNGVWRGYYSIGKESIEEIKTILEDSVLRQIEAARKLRLELTAQGQLLTGTL